MSKICVLGSGLMAETVVCYLTSKDHFITIASNILKDAEEIAKKFKNCTAVSLDVTNQEKLRDVIKGHRIVISYVPAFLHIHVAKACLLEKIDMITASYISPELQALDNEAKNAGLVFFNEIGLDPGIDHLQAIKLIHEIRKVNGKIISYESWCGGVPCPDICDNPLGYKFSWSPLAALNALKNDALFFYEGKEVSIPQKDVLFETFTLSINQAFNTEGYANRNSLKYKDLYGLTECKSVIRGTIRYKGFCVIMGILQNLGVFDNIKLNENDEINWFDVLERFTLLKSESPEYKSENYISLDILKEIYENCNIESVKQQTLANKLINFLSNHKFFKNFKGENLIEKIKILLNGLVFLEFFNENSPKLDKSKNLFENCVEHLKEKLPFKEGERDCVILETRFAYQLPNSTKTYRIKSSLIEFGEKKGCSAMSKLVSCPIAIATQLILEGHIKEKGVIMPHSKETVDMFLERLQEYGINLKETQF